MDSRALAGGLVPTLLIVCVVVVLALIFLPLCIWKWRVCDRCMDKRRRRATSVRSNDSSQQGHHCLSMHLLFNLATNSLVKYFVGVITFIWSMLAIIPTDCMLVIS